MKKSTVAFLFAVSCAAPAYAEAPETCEPGCWLEEQRVCEMRGHHPFCSNEWFWVCDPCYDPCDPNDGDTCPEPKRGPRIIFRWP